MNTLLGMMMEAKLEAEYKYEQLFKQKDCIDNELLDAMDEICRIENIIKKL